MRARARADVTTEMFLTARSASISSDVFSQTGEKFCYRPYTDVQWARQRVATEESFQAYREARPEGQTMHHYIREEWNRLAIQRPHVMVASDAMPLLSYERKVVPNGAGTFCTHLGQYVREGRAVEPQRCHSAAAYSRDTHAGTCAGVFQKGADRCRCRCRSRAFDPQASQPAQIMTSHSYRRQGSILYLWW